MRGIAVLTIIFGSLPFILVRPYIGILMWYWVSFMNPHRLTWGSIREFPVGLIIAVTTIAAWLLSRESKRIPLNTLTTLVLIFGAWTSLTTLFAIVPKAAYEDGWTEFMKILVMSFVTLPLMCTRKRLNALIWVTAASIGFFGLKGGVFAILTGSLYKVYGPPGTAIGDNNALALALLMVIPLMRYLQLQAQSRWARWGLSGAMVSCGISVVASYSRGAFLTGFVMLVMLLLKSRRRAMLAVALASALAVGIVTVPEKWYHRIETIETYQKDASAQGRFDAWLFAIKLALDHPILGGGFWVTLDSKLFNSYVPTAARARSFHSIYFQVLGEHGFIGLTLFLMIGMAALRTATIVIRETKKRPDLAWAHNLAAMIQVSLVAYATGGLFLNKAYLDLYYCLLMMLVLTKILAWKALKANPVRSVSQHRGVINNTAASAFIGFRTPPP